MYPLSTWEEAAAHPSCFNKVLLGETKMSNQILHDVEDNGSIRTTSPAHHIGRNNPDIFQ